MTMIYVLFVYTLYLKRKYEPKKYPISDVKIITFY